MFKSEINYLAHHVSWKGVLPSKKNLEFIAQCPPPDTYTKVKSFVGLVGHYRCFIKGFAKIAAPLYDLTSGDNKDKKSEHIDLSPEARDTYTKVKSFVGLVGHYRCFIKGLAKIAAHLYDLTSGDNKDKKSEHIDLSPEVHEAFDHLKAACLQAPILAFPDFSKPFLLETDASGRGLGAVLSQKQADG